MADTVVVRIAGDIKDVQTKLDEVGESADRMGKAIAAGVAFGAAALAGIAVTAFSFSSDVAKAQNQLQASLGLGTEGAEAFGAAIEGVFVNNFGESVEEVGAAVGVVAQQFRDLDPSGVQAITENAFRLKDVFGIEVAGSVDAVKTLMANFGLTSEQAFDFIARGTQLGLDRSGDFLATIGEYSTQFANGGADAGQFFSLLQSGLQGGMLGTDKAADAFKEFRVRIQDGSKLTAESLKALGIDSAKLGADMASGQMTAAQAFQLVTGKIAETKDSTVQFQAGVGLLGTQFEDLGLSGVLAMDMTRISMDDLAGTTAGLDAKYKDLGSVMQGIWRGFLVEIKPVGDAILGIINQNWGPVTAALGLVRDTVKALASGEGFDKLYEQFTAVFGEEMAANIAGVLDPLARFRTEVLPVLLNVAQAAAGVLGPALLTVAGAVKDTLVTAIQDLLALGGGIVQFFADNQLAVDALGAVLVTLASAGVAQLVIALPGMIAATIASTTAFIAQAVAAGAAAAATVAAALPFIALGVVIGAVVLAGIEIIRNWDLITFAAQTMARLIGYQFEQLGIGAKRLIDSFLAIGRDLVAGLTTGISNAWGGLTSWFQDKISALPEGVRKFLGISSPSKVFAEIGRQIPLGLAQGIEETSPEAIAALKALLEEAQQLQLESSQNASRQWQDNFRHQQEVENAATIARHQAAADELNAKVEAWKKEAALFAEFVKQETDFAKAEAKSRAQEELTIRNDALKAQWEAEKQASERSYQLWAANIARIRANLDALNNTQVQSDQWQADRWAAFQAAMSGGVDMAITDAGRSALAAAGFDVEAALNSYRGVVNYAAAHFQVPPSFASWLASMLSSLNIPGAATGASVLGSGLAFIHQGEQVIPADLAPLGAGAGGRTINVNLSGPIYGFRDFENRIWEAIEQGERRGRGR